MRVQSEEEKKEKKMMNKKLPIIAPYIYDVRYHAHVLQ